MALNFIATNLHPTRCSSLPPPFIIIPIHKNLFNLHYPSRKTLAQSEGIEGAGVAEEDLPASLSGYESDGSSLKLTICERLAQLVGDRDDNFGVPPGKNLKKVSAKFLTISQKRNIRRQAYLNELSQRNDSVFFATIGTFLILPPFIILAIAVLTGYVQLFP